jgi:hypothetical protein
MSTDSVWSFESEAEETASYILSQDIELAQTTEAPELIDEIRSYFEDESWESIQKKLSVECSVWYVWWMAGVQRFMQKRARTHV